MSVDYIAILGFGRECSDLNRSLAYDTGAELAKSDFGTAAGNIASTFHYAFEGAKSAGGSTLAIVEENLRGVDHSFCDELHVVSDVATKHKKLAELCAGAIIIGGGSGTRKVASRFMEIDKPVVAIVGSGGIVSHDLDLVVIRTKSAKESVDRIAELVPRVDV